MSYCRFATIYGIDATMKITWLGHAAFLIETVSDGNSVEIITDPYSSAIGFDPIALPADIVTLSHVNPKYHSHLGDIFGNPEIVDGLSLAPRETTVRGVRFGAIQVFEDLTGEGPNAMVRIESEGLRILHMGDLGHALTEATIEACGRVDILLALAGGPPTIGLPDLRVLCDRMRPRIVIPMHFGVPKLDMNLRPVADFAALLPADRVIHEPGCSMEITVDSLPDKMELRVLRHAR